MARATYQKKRELERAIERDREFLSTAAWSLKKTTEHYSEATDFPYGTGTVRDVLVELGLYSVKPKGKVETAAADDAGLYVTAASYLELVRRVDAISQHVGTQATLLRERMDEMEHKQMLCLRGNSQITQGLGERITALEKHQSGMGASLSEWSATFAAMVSELSDAKKQLAEVLESMTVPAAE